MNTGIARSILSHFEHKGVTGTDLTDKVVEKLSGINPIIALRISYLSALAVARLPHVIKSIFAVGNGSTYSPGSGFFYGLFSYPGMPWEAFQSSEVFLTLLLFHLAALLIFFIGIRLGIRPVIAALAATLFLFSVSAYSFGYHLGSTTWNTVAALLWLFLVLRAWGTPRVYKVASWSTAILIFFSYPIVFYWFGFLVVRFLQEYQAARNETGKSWKKFSRTAGKLLKSQVAAIVLVIVMVAMFYPLGEGRLGVTSARTFFADFYYIILNFFSFYTHSSLWDAVQFAIGFVIVAWLLVGILRLEFLRSFGRDAAFLGIGLVVLVIFGATIIAGIVGFTPARHLLLLTPVIFVGTMLVFNDAATRSRIAPMALVAVWAVVLTLGFWALAIRIGDVRDETAGLTLPDQSVVNEAVVQDCSYNLVYKDWGSTTPIEFADPTRFKVGDTYFYVSQTTSLDQALQFWKNVAHYNVSVQAKNVTAVDNPTFFTAYAPRRYGFDRPNSLYTAIIKILGVIALPTSTSPVAPAGYLPTR